MQTASAIATVNLYPKANPKLRMFALWYFCTLITLWTILGHTVLGFEQSWAQPAVAILAACATQYFLEWVDARVNGRTPRYVGGASNLVNFLLPAWIPGAAVGMLIYPNELLWPMVFAAALSVASKVIVRAPLGNGKGSQHVFNPSNFGITFTLVAMPWVGLAPPYHFTENLTGIWYWVLPGVVLVSGIIVHALFTGRLPLVAAWITGFLAQAAFRAWYADVPLLVLLVPMTSAAFILFTLYMIPDPATTPLKPGRQVVFGLAVAAVYCVLQMLHVVFGLFIALFLVCALRGISMYVGDRMARLRGPVPAPAA